MALRVAFIGLGVMGFPMAGHLARAGHDVVVYNRTASKASDWVAQYGGRSAPTPSAAADGAEIVFACVGRDGDVAEVTRGPQGAFAAMGKGTVFVDHTTASAGNRARTGRCGTRARFRFRRCAGVRRRAGREERPADNHVRRQRARLRQGRTRDGRLCETMPADGSGRFRATDQDGQPDLHRRRRAGTVRRLELCACRRPRSPGRC